jgi:AbrB family looped-hinge helix DNA binding protein
MAKRKTTQAVQSAQDAGTPLVVSGRGQVTLPSAVRARLRIREGSLLLLYEEEGRLVLNPAAVAPVDTYSDDQIAELVLQDRITPLERRKLRRRWRLPAR